MIIKSNSKEIIIKKCNPVKNKFLQKRGFYEGSSFKEFEESQISNKYTSIELIEQGKKGIDTLQMFINRFSENSKINEKEWFPNIRNHKSMVEWKTKSSSYYKEKDEQKCIFSYEDDSIRLEFSNVNDLTIELLFINVQNKNKGFGKNILNTILDVCDELGFFLKVLPVNYDVPKNMKMTDREYLKWLREWYKSFDLVSLDKTPNLYYVPKIFKEFCERKEIKVSKDFLTFLISKNFSRKELN
jgi:hypothetical protein